MDHDEEEADRQIKLQGIVQVCSIGGGVVRRQYKISHYKQSDETSYQSNTQFLHSPDLVFDVKATPAAARQMKYNSHLGR